MKVVVFGAGKIGTEYYLRHVETYRPEIEIVCFADNNKAGQFITGKGIYRIISAKEIKEVEYDSIVIAMSESNGSHKVYEQLINDGIPKEKLILLTENDELWVEILAGRILYDESHPRVRWLRNFALYLEEQGIGGAVSECGVNQGDFAYYINLYFRTRKLYLFDTFEGFTRKDVEAERDLGDNMFLDGMFNKVGMFSDTSVEIVMKKLLYPDKVVIRKGRFPETAEEIEDRFAFVNLDMDLYLPTLEGLKFFYPRMNKGGVILCHDFFRYDLPGVKKAVSEFESLEGSLNMVPIGDFCSIAIIR